MGSAEELTLLEEQLAGLAKAVESDTNLPANLEDYLVTLNSLKERIKTHKYPLTAGTVTGRMSTKDPNPGTKPRTGTPVEWDRMSRSEQKEAKAMNPHIHPPVTDRRAAIEHTRKLNEIGNDS